MGWDESGVPLSKVEKDELADQAVVKGRGVGKTPVKKVASLKPELDIVELKSNMEKTLPALMELANLRYAAGDITRAAYEAEVKTLQRVGHIFQLGVFVRGVDGKVLLKEYPVGLSRKQQGGRLYNWARGFVHPGYLGVEATAMNLQLGQARFMRELILDPKAAEIFAEIAVKRGQITKGQLKYVQIAAMRAFRGEAGVREFEKKYKTYTEDMKERQLADLYIHLTGKFPPQYLAKQKQRLRSQDPTVGGRPTIGYSFPGMGSLVAMQENTRRKELDTRNATLYGGGYDAEVEAYYPGTREYLETTPYYQTIIPSIQQKKSYRESLRIKKKPNVAGQRVKIDLRKIFSK